MLFCIGVIIITSSWQDRNDDKILIEAFLDVVITGHTYKSLVEEKLVYPLDSDVEFERLSEQDSVYNLVLLALGKQLAKCDSKSILSL